MDIHGWIALGTLVAVVTLFLTKWIPMEATALALPVLLAATGTLRPAEALSGFGNHAVIVIGGIFLLGSGLKESGVATLLARLIERVARGSEARTIFLIMVAVSGLSAIMSSAATVAVFLPVAVVLARRTGTSTSHLMLPLSYAAILGGTLTLIGTAPNLILGNDLAVRTGGDGLGMFEFTRVGLPVAGLGIVYMATLGRRLLPRRSPRERMGATSPPLDIARRYATAAQLYLMKIVDASRIAGKTVAEAGVGGTYQLDLLMVRRRGNLGTQFVHPRPDLRLEAGDELYLEGEAAPAWRFAEEERVQFGVADPADLERILGFGLTLAEVTLSPRSDALGQTLRDLRFRNRTGLGVVAIWRAGEVITTGTAGIPLQIGDAFMVTGRMRRVRALAADPDFILLTDTSEREDIRRAPLALALMLAALLPPLLGWLPLAVSVIGAALLMGLTRCVSRDGARRAVDWRVLFLLIGTIPLGIAMDRHGVAAYAAGFIVDLNASLGDPSLFASLFLLASALCLTCNNGAAAVILAPVAWQASQATGVSPARAFLAVAFGASCAFLLPFGNQCNLMVMGPGGYRTRDYVRAGGGLTVLMAVTTVVLLSVL